MKDFKIKVKDVKEFVKSAGLTYASGAGKRFFVRLHAGPGVERYVVESKGIKNGFNKAGEAVRFFNEI